MQMLSVHGTIGILRTHVSTLSQMQMQTQTLSENGPLSFRHGFI